jgi:hypothetical protein
VLSTSLALGSGNSFARTISAFTNGWSQWALVRRCQPHEMSFWRAKLWGSAPRSSWRGVCTYVRGEENREPRDLKSISSSRGWVQKPLSRTRPTHRAARTRRTEQLIRSRHRVRRVSVRDSVTTRLLQINTIFTPSREKCMCQTADCGASRVQRKRALNT